MPWSIHSHSHLSLRASKPVMNSLYIYMRSEADCVWYIAVQQATMQCRRRMSPQNLENEMLLLQDL
jgi:hypothetical protein